MMRSLWLEPRRAPSSYSCTSNGALTRTKPPLAPAAGIVTAIDAVVPAWMVTFCRDGPEAPSSTTVWAPGAKSVIVSGVTPRETSSTVTRAPAG